MSSYERWRKSKIVVNRSDELLGGIKNALERGQNLETIKKSFISAGYTTQEVEMAAQKSGKPPQIPQQTQKVASHEEKKIAPITKPKKTFLSKIFKKKERKVAPITKPKEVISPGTNQKFPKILTISLIIISGLIIIFAAILGLYWDRLF